MSVSNRITKMVDDDTSFALLRANPKLTGNIKVVVDSDENLYLDTFKVSLGLSQYQYRHIPINPSEYYGRTIMAKMKDMPSEDMYKVEDACYNLFAMADDYDGQYYDTYNYGVRTNFDRLYKENFALLAPICIRKTIPDFFLVFKTTNDGITSGSVSGSEILSIYNSKLVKVFDLREGSNLGTYIRNIRSNARNFVGDVYTGYSYDHFNGYNGISLDRGTVSCVYESTVDERSFNSQVGMNNWYTLGFERNHMVSKDIVNFEFMFNDETEMLFSNPTYFGVYVRLNGEGSNFSCIGYSDGQNTFNITPSGSEFTPASFPNIIYGLSTPEGFIRLNENIFKDSVVTSYCRKPDKGLISADIIDDSPYNDENRCYVSFFMNQPTTPGEHYKIIDHKRYRIYEVVIRSGDYSSDISEADPITFQYGVNTYTNYRVFVNNIKKRQDIDKANIKREIQRQSKLIARAFNALPTDLIDAYSDNDGNVSIIYTYSGDFSLMYPVDFYWICAPNETSYEPIRIFGIENINGTPYPGTDVQPDDQEMKIYFPVGYEYLGQRRIYGAISYNLKKEQGSQDYHILINTSITDQVISHGSVLYKVGYDDYSIFDKDNMSINVVKYFVHGSYRSITSTSPCVIGLGSIKNYMVKISGSKPYGSRLQIFENTPLNAGVCSIFNIKDYYHDVIDSSSHFIIKVNEDGDPYSLKCPDSITPGEYSADSTDIDSYSRGSAITQGQEEYIHNYIDIYDTFDIDTDSSGNFVLNNKDSLAQYILNLQNNAHYNLDVSLIAPYCCKWRGLSTDNWGMRMRSMLSLMDIGYVTMDEKPYLMGDASSYFIPGDDDSDIGFEAMSSYSGPLYKGLNYRYSISDIVHSDTLSIDDNLYTEGNPYNKFSKVYLYGNNEIEFISAGIKIRISSSNKSLINLAKYVGYSVILIRDVSDQNSFRVLIDETTEQMEVLIYSRDITLKEIKENNENVYAIIKKGKNISENIDFSQGLRLDIINPYEVTREDSKFVETTKGSVHPAYCTPVMIDMFGFKNDYTNDINGYFGKNFNYSNLQISDIKSINQTWLQKVPDINNVIQQDKGIIDTSYTVITSHVYKNVKQGDGTSKIAVIDDPIRTYYASGTGNQRIAVRIKQVIDKSSYIIDPTKTRYIFENATTNIHNQDIIWQSYNYLIEYNDIENVQQSGSAGSFSVINYKDSYGMEISGPYTNDTFYKRMSLSVANGALVLGKQEDIQKGKTVTLFRSNYPNQQQQGLLENIRKIGVYTIDECESNGYLNYNLKFFNIEIDLGEGYDWDILWFMKGDSLIPQNIHNDEVDFMCYSSAQGVTYIPEDDYTKKDGIDKNVKFSIRKREEDKYPTKATLEIELINPEESIAHPSGSIFTLPEGGEKIADYYGIEGDGTITENTINQSMLLLTSTSALTLYKDMSITRDYWHQKMCRLFTVYDTCDENYGYISGYEKNCYIASRGITRYGSDYSNKIELNDWQNNIIIDNDKRNVTIDITSSLLKKIKSYQGFQNNWTNLPDIGEQTETYQNKYIENTILNNIKINDKNIFKLYINNDSRTFEFMTTKPDDTSLDTEVQNLHNVLSYENNRYYMTIYGLKSYSYYAEFYIEL